MEHTPPLFEQLVSNSDKFLSTIGLREYPTEHNLIQNIAGDNEDKKRRIEEHAKGARILLLADLKTLILEFMEIKKTVSGFIGFVLTYTVRLADREIVLQPGFR
jgi:hypothetical protein